MVVDGAWNRRSQKGIAARVITIDEPHLGKCSLFTLSATAGEAVACLGAIRWAEQNNIVHLTVYTVALELVNGLQNVSSAYSFLQPVVEDTPYIVTLLFSLIFLHKPKEKRF